MMSLAHLVADIPELTIAGDPSIPIASISFDSRDVATGCLFVALRGGYTDGHKYLQKARDAGAVGAVVESETAAQDVDGFRAVARVPDTRATLALLATRFYGHPSRNITTIGVTGTDGKTTTSHFIDAVARAGGHQTGLIGTVEVRIGDDINLHESRQTTPESLIVQRYLAQMRDAGVTLATIEATSHGLELHRLDGCEFDVGVVTNITHEHLDFHGTVERYRAAKGGLFRRVDQARSVGKRGIVIVNMDDEGARSIIPDAGRSRLVTYSLDNNIGADVRAQDVDVRSDGSTFKLLTPGGCRRVTIHLPGRYNIANALAAAATGMAIDLGLDTVVAGLSSLRSVPGRMETIDEGQPFAVIVDYAHSPEAIRSVLIEARRATNNRVLVVFGSAGERDVEKRASQGAVAIQYADYAVFTSEDPRFEDPDAIIDMIAGGAVGSGGQRGVDFDCIEDRRTAIQAVLLKAEPGDIVILAGKGHERSMIYGANKVPWDEAEVARSLLNEMGYVAVASTHSDADSAS